MLTLIRAIIRPEKADAVLAALMDAGFPAVTKYSVAGRGKQRGIKIGEVKEEDKDFVIKTIMNTARSGAKGAFGDGKIFVSEVECAYTISSGVQEGALEVTA